MEGNSNIESVRALLSQGDSGKALQLLIGLLEKDTRFKDNLLRTLRVAEANFNLVRQQELKGILSFQEAQREYSKVNDTLLAVLDDFEAGRVPSVAAPAGGENRRRWLLIGGGAVLLLAALAFWLLKGRDAGCPKFEDKEALHVLILPFDNLGKVEAKPALRIQNDIQELTKKGGFPAEVKIRTREMQGDVNSQDAERIGRQCGADLVIYGQYLAFEKDSIRVKMGFKFLQEGGREGNLPFKTFRDITAVQPTRDLQDAIFSVCAMIAVRKKNWQVAKRWMGRIREKEPQEMAMNDWIGKQSQ